MNPDKSPQQNLNKEYISSPAVKYKDQIFLAGNHGMALDELENTFPDALPSEVVDGYVTSTGRFVDRQEGNRIMEESS